jgi:hypothetical protein
MTLTMEVDRLLSNQHGLIHAYVDDIYVHLCTELGIDYRKFEHNVPKLPIDDFVSLAMRRFASLALSTNETQCALQGRRWTNLWHQWVRQDCRRAGCDEDSHYDCAHRNYVRPDFWDLAKQLESARQTKAKLIGSIDVAPRGRSVKIANDALARIAIADGSR